VPCVPWSPGSAPQRGDGPPAERLTGCCLERVERESRLLRKNVPRNPAPWESVEPGRTIRIPIVDVDLRSFRETGPLGPCEAIEKVVSRLEND
jgi:hypothetical protein